MKTATNELRFDTGITYNRVIDATTDKSTDNFTDFNQDDYVVVNADNFDDADLLDAEIRSLQTTPTNTVDNEISLDFMVTDDLENQKFIEDEQEAEIQHAKDLELEDLVNNDVEKVKPTMASESVTNDIEISNDEYDVSQINKDIDEFISNLDTAPAVQSHEKDFINDIIEEAKKNSLANHLKSYM